jgi:hypothetical protein
VSHRITQIEVAPYSDGWKTAWDACVRRARNGHFMFERAFVEYHRDRFAEASMLGTWRGEVVAVLPAHRENDSLVSHRGLPFAGWIVAPEVRLRHVREFFSRLRAHAVASGMRRFIVTPTPWPYHRAPCEEETWCLSELGGSIVKRRAAAGFRVGTAGKLANENRRRLISSAGDCRVRIADDLAPFMDRVAEHLWRRHRARPLHTIDEIQRLRAAFPQNIRACEVWRGERLLGGQLVFVSNHVVRPQHGFVSPEWWSLDASTLVIAAVMRRPEFAGLWWDFGTSMNPATDGVDETLLAFKESLGARLVVQSTWEWSF